MGTKLQVNPATGKLDVVKTPSGSSGEIQYNNGSDFGASVNLSFNGNDIYLVGNLDSSGGNVNFTRLANPDCSLATATLDTSAGNVTGTNFKYVITFETDEGETGSDNTTNTVSTATNQQITLTDIPVSTDSRVTGRKIYRTCQAKLNYYYEYIDTIADNTTTTYQDNTAVSGGYTSSDMWTTLNTAGGNLTGCGKLTLGTGTGSDAAQLNVWSPDVNRAGACVNLYYGSSTTGQAMTPETSGAYSNSHQLRLWNLDSTKSQYLHILGNGNWDAGISFQGAGQRGRYYTTSGYHHVISVNDAYGSPSLYIQADNGANGINARFVSDLKFYYGIGGDASIQYDGSNLVFNSQEVGTGNFVFDNGWVFSKGVATPSSTDANGFYILSSGLGAQFACVKGLYIGSSYAGANPDLGEIKVGNSANLTFNVGGSDRVYIDTSGNMGIYEGDFVFDSNVKKIYLGENQESSIMYDGSNLVFESQEAGTANYSFLSGNAVFVGTIKAANFETNSTSNMVYIGSDIPATITTGDENIGVGTEALEAVTTGYRNIAMGYQAGKYITTGWDNFFLGSQAAGYGAVGHTYNVVIGTLAMYGIVDGNAQANTQNVAIGNSAMQNAYYLRRNIAIGALAMAGAGNTISNGAIGLQNVAIGYYSMKNIGGAGYCNYNVCIGSQTAQTLTGGDENIIIGYLSDVSSANVSYEIVIGSQQTGRGTNTTLLGHPTTTATYLPNDNHKLYFGAADDASIYYDGADFNIDPQEVGSGDLHLKNSSMVFEKTSGVGIKVDTTTPTYPWHDLLGQITTNDRGASPSLQTYIGNIDAIQFSNSVTNEAFITFHMPHDYVEGTDLYLHAHWSQSTADTGAVAKWSFDVSYAKGFDQVAFISPITTYATQTASSTAYQHMVAEVQLSASGASASQLETSTLETDGLVLVRVWRDPSDATDTLTQAPFLHMVDIHYQSKEIGTKNKAPGFYT